MSKDKKREKGSHRSGSCAGPGVIKRVVRGLSERFGIDRGLVITAFILGFVFVPMLALITFGLAWIWVGNPERFERFATTTGDRLKTAYEAAFTRFDSKRSEPSEPTATAAEADVDFPALREQFEALERRAAGMETFVTSEEMALRNEFRRMGEKA